LAVEGGYERLTLLIVGKFNRDVDCVSVLIINKPSRLIPMAIKPFAHRRHLVSKIRGAHSNSNSAHSRYYVASATKPSLAGAGLAIIKKSMRAGRG
jgi:hypothetical protein